MIPLPLVRDQAGASRRRGSYRGALAMVAMVAVLAGWGCGSSPGADGSTPAATPATPAAGPERAPSPPDCRTHGCSLGDTCVSHGGCDVAWVCEPCATGVVMEPTAYCGCDGKTFTVQTVGCRPFEYARVGPC